MNQKVVEMALEIERGEREASPANSAELIEVYKKLS
jgi:hypothetical protein